MPKSNFSEQSLPDLNNKVFLVTGGNTGIGKATVAGLASHGATIYMGARSEERAQEAINDIRKSLPKANIKFLKLDLGDYRSVVDAAETLKSKETVLHGLVNNAGVMGIPYALTKDGYEIQLQTNYMSHWLLTHHLLPLLNATAAAENTPGAVRVVNITSDGHEKFTLKDGIRFNDMNLKAESAMSRYGHSKLANILHIKYLDTLYGPDSAGRYGPGILFAAVHPGHIDTSLNLNATEMAPGFVLRLATSLMKCVGVLDTQAQGALSSLYAVASVEFKSNQSGVYIVPYAKIGKPSAMAQDLQLAGKLWDWTQGELKGKGFLLD